MAQSLIVSFILRVIGRKNSLRYASCRKLPYSYADKIRSRSVETERPNSVYQRRKKSSRLTFAFD